VFSLNFLTTPAEAQSLPGWKLVWSDEFDQPDGSAPDPTKWGYDIGNGCPNLCGWGNNELEYYTSRPENVYVSGGSLNIVARNEAYNGYDYTSAKLKTFGLFSKTYGRFEFRARLPEGQGYWPALWMMPQDSEYGGWAASGEIDVMENRGREPTRTGGTIHYGGSWPENVHSGAEYVFPGGGTTTDFHVYAFEWNTNSMKWYVDGVLYQTQTSWWSASAPYPAPFDKPFYIIMNLAVGGNYGGDPDGSTVFPGLMQVDYVRVYAPTNALPPTHSGMLLNGNFETGLLSPWVGKGLGPANPAGGNIVDPNGLVYDPDLSGNNTQGIRNPTFGAYSCKVYGAYNGYPNMTGFYQDVDALPGSVWTATIKARSQYTDQIRDDAQAVAEVSFLDAANSVIAKYASQVFDTGTPANTWIDMDVTEQVFPDTGSTNQLHAPPGTEKLRFEVTFSQTLYDWGSVYFDEARLEEVVQPPEIVPAHLSAILQQGNIRISFQTQDGVDYTVGWKANLTDPTWIPIETVQGDGSMKSVSYPANDLASYFTVEGF